MCGQPYVAENRLSSELSNLHGDLDDFVEWSVTNQLKLNPTKCQGLQICFMHDPPTHPDFKIGQSVLAFVSPAKVLRVWLQNDLKLDTQVNYMNKNASKRLFMLRSLKRFGFNKSELVTVYKGYICPLLEYSDVIWHSSLTSNQTHQLERVPKRALRIILGTDYISYAYTLDVCDVDHLSARREQHSLQFAQHLPKCSRTSKLLPPCRGEIHGRHLRNNIKLTQPRARTNEYACSPIPLCGVDRQQTPIIGLLAFYFLLCSPVSQFGLVSLLSIVVLLALFLAILFSFFFFSFLSHIVNCNSAFGARFCANKIISYHIISYHIISYHIIS